MTTVVKLSLMEIAVAIIAVAVILWIAYEWRQSGRRLEEIRRRNAGKPSSWEGSAEQSMLHSAGEMARWSSDRPH